ncbi:hypothetical protein HN51_035219 [Arachis hypogaea]|uniref:uncharacterized protein LOC107629899 n=1 Tax=Arachis ipaensis TaxID=130454 RepID=UPI0007AF62E4|nr:uncharacterized protein LOC107629899 [Arachis ipaensis]XP_025643364.1 uncharacterized protein LOC112737613 [Arachis hypogaea]QHO00225.1 uncharacterized protein DS421_13g404700 [Arachis hypogaea]
MSTTLLSPTLSFRPRLPPAKPQCFLRPPRFVTVFSPKELSRISRLKRFAVNDNDGAGSGGGFVDWEKAEKEARARSTMPERFRYLAKEAPDPPVRWPWLLVLGFLIYAWRAVLFELSNWKDAVFGIVRFMGNLLTYLFAMLYRFIGSPITFSIRCMEDSFYTVRAFYSWTINNAPIPELTTVIVLASVVLAIAEAAVPNCINKQPYVLTVSGLIGYAAVRGYISEPFFWTLLLGLYTFSKLIKKRDNVSCAMPVAAVLAAVGETWVRVLVLITFVALAIYQYSQTLLEGKQVEDQEMTERRIPVPLLVAALAIGLRLAAKWAGYRHLTWMVV